MSVLPRPKPAGTVYAARRCDACGRTGVLTQISDVTHVTARTRPHDVTSVEVCADWRDCIDHTPKEDRS